MMTIDEFLAHAKQQRPTNDEQREVNSAMDVLHEGLAIIRSLIGRTITQYVLAFNSLMLFFDEGSHEKKSGFRIWLEPPWHFSSAEAVLLGSYECQTEGDYSEPHWQNNDQLLNRLLGGVVKEIQIDERSMAVTIKLESRIQIRSFVNNAANDHCWHVDDYARGIAVYVDPQGWRLVDRQAPPQEFALGGVENVVEKILERLPPPHVGPGRSPDK